MTVTEFRELCEREWGEARGDIIGLRLTDESYHNLLFSVFTSRERHDLITDGEDELLNPVTRSVVKLAKGADSDTAEVRRYYAEPHPASA